MKKALMFLAVLAAPLAALADNAADYYTAGLHYYQQGQTDQAVQYLQGAIQVDPNYWQAYQVLGYCYYGQKDNLQALQAMDKSLQIHPDNPALRQFDDQVRAATPNAPPAPQASTDSALPPLPDQASSAGGTPTPAPSASTGIDPNLPKPGSISLQGTLVYVYPGDQDLIDFYGGGYTTGVQEAVEIHLGADYALSPNFQAGLALAFAGKTPATVTLGYDTEVWHEYMMGGALEANLLFPLNDGLNFILHGEGGFYTLVGTNVTVSGYDAGSVNLDSTGGGGAIAAGLEFLMDKKKSWAVDVELGYRFLTFSPLTQAGQIDGAPQSGDLTNYDGSDAAIEFSGPMLSATARLF